MFLQPVKAPANAKGINIKNGKDTIHVKFLSNTFQPVFIKNSKDSMHFDYEIRSVIFSGANGNQLNGWWLVPKNTTPHFTLVHFHGNAGFLLNHFPAISPLAGRGFQIFLFDYSGFGFSQGKATRRHAIEDANAALTYVKNNALSANTEIIIYGQSLGGHLAAVVAAQREKEIDGLVIEGAFSSHRDIASQRVPLLGRILVKEKYSARKSIKGFHKPVLVIHSTEDKTVPYSMGKTLFSLANSPKEFYSIGKPHLYGPTVYTDSIAAKIKRMANQK